MAIPLLTLTSCNKNKQTGANSLLWKVSKDGKESYIFGTVHLPSKQFEKIPAEVSDAIKSTDICLNEIEPDEKNQLEIAKGMRLSDEKNLNDIIGTDRFSKLAKIVTNYTPPISQNYLNRVKIWAALLFISYPKKGYDLSMDILLYQHAVMLGKRTEGLETATQQLSALESFTTEEQIQILDDAIAEAENGYPTVSKIIKAYVSQNLDEMVSLFSDKEKDLPEQLKEKYLNKMLIERNLIFKDSILKYTNEGSVFAAVGAGHIIGDGNLLQLLENEGFVVEPVEFKFPGQNDLSDIQGLNFLNLDKF